MIVESRDGRGGSSGVRVRRIRRRQSAVIWPRSIVDEGGGVTLRTMGSQRLKLTPLIYAFFVWISIDRPHSPEGRIVLKAA
ncbi:uncharacterized protein FOMMEDRAFT_154230 [Fomitiporia mediterranea MF3/22]|uniref:uncharacterized protein n=1 Tax=Fomitiporia mediterranea (strain MF3/22) TaxID=694068 RepID=UPI0004409A14|nr:uncharacterized protein FOMMEDRAFT_154230 [Fomitiporia mediterranea MF3/22]EJD05060.1 hypothetical protein FOMMEDRAFT_154230 [Fomitiporia mediterranea MF3/22]